MYIKTLKILTILIGIIFGLYVVVRFIVSFANPEKQISVSQTSVIQQMQSLGKMETSMYTIEKIIEGGTTDAAAFKKIIFGDTILLIAHGTVVGGFDLSRITSDDIDVANNVLTVRLPKPEILYSKLDNTQTKVYDRRLGLLTKGDKDLESQVRAAAEMSIREAACKGGILDQASLHMREYTSRLFLGLGFAEVRVEIPKDVVCM